MRRAILLVGLPVPDHPALIVPADRAVVLGRSSQCDLVVDHPSVSRRHARVTRAGDAGVRILDLGSRNGTFVDDVRVDEATVPCGRRVRFGEVALEVWEEGGPRRWGDDDLETDGSPAGGRRQRSWPGAARLTAAQRDVFDLLVQGLAEKVIARRLGVSAHTAHNHVGAIYRALGVHSRGELMALVLRGPHGRAAAPAAGATARTRPAGRRGGQLKLYYLSAADRDAYCRLLDRHGIAYSDPGGFVQLDTPVTPEVMWVLSAAVLS